MTSIPFSYSLLNSFFNVCGEQTRRTYIKRDVKKTFTVDSNLGGIDAHKELESRLKYKTPLPPALAAAEPFAASFERYPCKAEVAYAVDQYVGKAEFWGQPWLRGKFDVVAWPSPHDVLYADWKTGKPRESSDQGEIGAMLILANEPAAERVVTVNVWLKTGRLGPPQTFTRAADWSRLWAKWIPKMRYVEGLDEDKEWEKRPSPLCQWCPVTSCEFNTRRE